MILKYRCERLLVLRTELNNQRRIFGLEISEEDASNLALITEKFHEVDEECDWRAEFGIPLHQKAFCEDNQRVIDAKESGGVILCHD